MQCPHVPRGTASFVVFRGRCCSLRSPHHTCFPEDAEHVTAARTWQNLFTPNLRVAIIDKMRVIKRSVLVEFGKRHPRASGSLNHWYQLAKAVAWEGPAQVRMIFGNTVDFIANNRAVFDIKGNDYRLIGEINYRRRAVYIRFLGTHSEYDKVDAETVKLY